MLGVKHVKNIHRIEASQPEELTYVNSEQIILRILFAFYICRFVGFFPLGSFYVFLPQYLITNGLAELDASVAISLMGLAGAVGWGLIGIVTDRSGTD